MKIQRILASIRILTAKRFDVLIDELKALEGSFENDAEFNQALEGLQLGKQLALKGIDAEAIGVNLNQIGVQIGEADFEIAQLTEDLAEQNNGCGC